MKIEEVANTFFKWRPSFFLMEFSLSRTQDFGELRRISFMCESREFEVSVP